MKLNSIYLKYLYLFVIAWLISCEDSNQDKVEEKAVVPKDTIEKEVFPALGHDAPYITDSTYFGRNNYVEYIAGNIPIILSAPHGGALTPDEIPDRTYGTTVTDANTYQLTKVIMDSMVIRYGGRPHVILCRLKRTKLDANRDSIEAAQNNRFALRAFNEFHFYIDQAKKKIERDFGSGLFFDMHGHGANPDGFYDLRTWLGYLIKGDELDLSDDELKSNVDPSMSSIRALIDSSEFEFVELLRGSSSFGTMLTNLGFSGKSGIFAKISDFFEIPDFRENLGFWGKSEFSSKSRILTKILMDFKSISVLNFSFHQFAVTPLPLKHSFFHVELHRLALDTIRAAPKTAP